MLQNATLEIVGLVTTVTEDYDRVSMYGVRRALVQQQACALGLPLDEVLVPKNADNGIYEARMAEALIRDRDAGVMAVVFGDILLEDLRAYREEKLAPLELKAVFPLRKRDTRDLMETFIESGLEAVTTCVDTRALGEEFVGRRIDASFLADLPVSVDPCGEYGEYHSFAYDGPMFRERICFGVGEKVLREGRFYYCDLLPRASSCDRLDR